MTTMIITLYDEELDDEVDCEIPAKWIICDNCDGNGSHSKHLGAITQEDIDRDWSPDEFDDYLAGGYDMQCEVCKGSGKVLAPLYPNQEPAKTWLKQERDREAERRADMRTLYMESGGSMGSW